MVTSTSGSPLPRADSRQYKIKLEDLHTFTPGASTLATLPTQNPTPPQLLIMQSPNYAPSDATDATDVTASSYHRERELGMPPLPPVAANGDADLNGDVDALLEKEECKPKGSRPMRLKLFQKPQTSTPTQTYVSIGRQIMRPPFAGPNFGTPAHNIANATGSVSAVPEVPIAPELFAKSPSAIPVPILQPTFSNGATDTLITEAPATDKEGRRARAKKTFHNEYHLFGDVYMGDEDEEPSNELMSSKKRSGNDTAAGTYPTVSSIINGPTNKYTAASAVKIPRFTPSYDEPVQDRPAPTPSQSHTRLASPPPYSNAFIPPAKSTTTFRPVEFDADTDMLFNTLLQGREEHGIQDELPSLFTVPEEGEHEMGYSAKRLTNLYIYCYQHNEFDFCDLIADVWIRAFHKANRLADLQEKFRPWLKKSLLVKDPQLYSAKGAKELPRDYFMLKEMKLDKSVTYIPRTAKERPRKNNLNGESLIECVNMLYHATSRTCPARLLWADVLSLHGYPLSLMLNRQHCSTTDSKQEVSGNRTDYEFHPDLVWDIMSTSLRMVRCKLSLKCEEINEGSWCGRYHLHGRQGHECYRVLAKEKETAMEERLAESQVVAEDVYMDRTAEESEH